MRDGTRSLLQKPSSYRAMATTMDDSDMCQGEPDPTSETHLLNSRGCFCFPCFGPRKPSNSGPGLWERIRAAESEERWWARGFTAIRKAREWSEIVAGPKWKTFIRRFNRNRSGGGGRHGKFQYDPLSYALNFDEGQNGNFEEGDFGRLRDFSARYASVSGPVKSAADSGKDVTLL